MATTVPIKEAINWKVAQEILPTLESIQGKHKAQAVVSKSQGPGSFLDAPGWPQHYVQSIDDWHVLYGGRHVKEQYYALYCAENKTWYVILEEQFRAIWVPLPEEHNTIQNWEKECYTYFNHCYSHDGESLNASKAIIWPLNSTTVISKANIPPSGKTLYGRFNNPARQERWEEIKAEVERMHEDDWAEAKQEFQHNFWEENRHLLVAENYYAVLYIRQFYPEHQPRLDWFKVAEAPE